MTAGIRVEARRDRTIFHVHREWGGSHNTFICSSRCAGKHAAIPDTWGNDDDALVNHRLQDRHGAGKGRVLYYFDEAPLKGGAQRRAAAALLHLDKKALEITHVPTSVELVSDDREMAFDALVRCAVKIARAARRKRVLLYVPPEMDAGDVCDRLGFDRCPRRHLTRRQRGLAGRWLLREL